MRSASARGSRSGSRENLVVVTRDVVDGERGRRLALDLGGMHLEGVGEMGGDVRGRPRPYRDATRVDPAPQERGDVGDGRA